MFTSLSPDSKYIQDCRPDCPLLDSCRAQGLKRCPMRLKEAGIAFPFAYSLLLHTMVAFFILMLPVYGGRAGPTSLTSYLVFLAGGGKPVQARGAPPEKKRPPAGRTVERRTTGAGKAVKPANKATVEKAGETPENIGPPIPAEEAVRSAAPAPDNTPGNATSKTAGVKAATEMAEEEAVSEPAPAGRDEESDMEDLPSTPETSASPPEPAGPVPSNPAPGPVPAGRSVAGILSDTGALLQYHEADKGKVPSAGEEAKAPAPVLTQTGGNTASRDVPAPPAKSAAAAQGKKPPANGAGKGAASKMVAAKTQGSKAAAPAPGQKEAAAVPLSVPGGGQATASGRQAASPALKPGEKAANTLPTGKEQAGKETRPAPIGIAGAAALLPQDIRIEVTVTGEDRPSVFTRLLKRNYPSAASDYTGDTDLSVKGEEESGSSGSVQVKRIFSVVKAGKGIYTFVIGNESGKTCVADVAFLLFERSARERKKEYKAVRLPPGTGVKFRFLVPDAIFWDDDNRFTGSTEDSDSITKFNSDTGLIWRERKDE